MSIDFSNDVATVSGDSASSLTVTAADGDGNDVSVSQLEDALLVGNVGYVTFTGGASGSSHLINMRIETAHGFEYEHDIQVPVTDDA